MAHDFVLTQGDSLPLEATVTVPGIEDPLLGARFFFTVKRSSSDADAQALIRKSSPGNGITHVAPNRGQWEITGDDTLDLAATDLDTKLFWDCKYRAANGQVKTLRRGTLRVQHTITRDTSA